MKNLNKKIKVDKKGLGFSELTWLAINHSVCFSIVNWMINNNMDKLALRAIRAFI